MQLASNFSNHFPGLRVSFTLVNKVPERVSTALHVYLEDWTRILFFKSFLRKEVHSPFNIFSSLFYFLLLFPFECTLYQSNVWSDGWTDGMVSRSLGCLQCNAALGMKTLFDHLYAPPPKVMLFGDACNSVTDPIAKASRFFHLIQVSTFLPSTYQGNDEKMSLLSCHPDPVLRSDFTVSNCFWAHLLVKYDLILRCCTDRGK